jgi:hypothetical protein
MFLNDGIGIRDTAVEWGFDHAGKIRHIDIRHLFIQEGLIKGIVNRTTKLIQNTVNFRPDVGTKQGRRGKGVQRVAAMLAATLDGSAGQLVPIGRRSVSVDVSVVEHFAFGAMLLVGMVVIVLTACYGGALCERKRSGRAKNNTKKIASDLGVVGDRVFRTRAGLSRGDIKTHLYEDCESLEGRRVIHQDVCDYCARRSKVEALKQVQVTKIVQQVVRRS